MYLLELWFADQILEYRWSFEREELEDMLELVPGYWKDSDGYEITDHSKFDFARIVEISDSHATQRAV